MTSKQIYCSKAKKIALVGFSFYIIFQLIIDYLYTEISYGVFVFQTIELIIFLVLVVFILCKYVKREKEKIN
jgi:hypothetical protein